jgi:hypothetical protein
VTEVNEIGNDTVVSASAEVGNGHVCPNCERPLRLLPHPLAEAILTAGMVLCACEFIYLSFIHPDAGNIVIPLILKPILDTVVRRWRARKEADV